MKFKSWVAVIPSEILYSKNLNDKDKLVFAVISNLTHDKGYCWASNKYISEILNCSSITISRSISKLDKLGFIKNELNKNENGTSRKIFLKLSFINNPFIKNDIPPNHGRQPNNIVNNIVNDNNKNSKELLNYINSKFGRNFRIINKEKLKSRLKTFTIDDIKESINNAYNDKYHIENNYIYLTPEYFLRNDSNIDKWLNKKIKNDKKNIKSKTGNYAEQIGKEFGW